MAEHQNARLVRRLHEALTSGDFDTAAELFAPDAVWHLPGHGPLAGDQTGRASILAAMRRFEHLSGSTLRVTVHDVLANDEHVVALLQTIGMRGEKSYQAREIDVYHVGHGRITEFWSFSEDQAETDAFWSG